MGYSENSNLYGESSGRKDRVEICDVNYQNWKLNFNLHENGKRLKFYKQVICSTLEK